MVNKLIRGEHRKNWNIVISYDEVSQLYCCKLMPLFGKFERKTRELVYITIIKIFGVDWYEKSFEKGLQDDLKSRGKNTTQLIEGALNELTYEQLNQALVPWLRIHTVPDEHRRSCQENQVLHRAAFASFLFYYGKSGYVDQLP